jgi:hypothetical protein
MARKIDSNSIGTYSDLWPDHESLYMSIFCRALDLLNIDDKQQAHENIISKKLYPILRHLCRMDGKGVAVPKWELPIPPDYNEENENHQKRPDFTCSFINTYANSDDTYEIPLHIECKRLGNKTSPTWDLNKNYVEKGIKRYDDKEYNYGEHASSGIMIGYIISSTKVNILSEVNSQLPENIDPLKFDSSEKLEICASKYRRKSTEPFDFTLHHIWVDLRSNT